MPLLVAMVLTCRFWFTTRVSVDLMMRLRVAMRKRMGLQWQSAPDVLHHEVQQVESLFPIQLGLIGLEGRLYRTRRRESDTPSTSMRVHSRSSLPRSSWKSWITVTS